MLEETVTYLDIPLYFRGDFFPAIQRINESPLNITKIKVKEIYRFLIEEVTMDHTREGSSKLIPLRIELADPTTQWDRTRVRNYKAAQKPGLLSGLAKPAEFGKPDVGIIV